jgi:predicted DsbA family dithiol-disulfide isomerase
MRPKRLVWLTSISWVKNRQVAQLAVLTQGLSMTKTLKIDFVSDVSCPWCAVGLASLQTALDRVAPDVKVDITFQPFELNPHMVPEGEDTTEHLRNKYGSTPEQAAAIRGDHPFTGR